MSANKGYHSPLNRFVSQVISVGELRGSSALYKRQLDYYNALFQGGDDITREGVMMNTKLNASYHLDIDLGNPVSDLVDSGIVELGASFSRMLAGVTGPVLLGIGSGISISAGFGSFGFSVLLDGLHNVWAIPLWVSQVAITILFFCIAWVWGKIRLGLGTLPALLLVGPAISLGANVTPDVLPFAWHVMAFITGLFMFAFGISLSAAAALGPDGVTALSLAAEKRWRWPVPKANFIWNLAAIALGVWMGGNIGPATLVGLLLTPVLIQYFLPKLRKLMVF
ncbi:MAG: YitT family protein [Granulosicoccus sp.]